jgi:hypothetical protein
MWIPTAIRQLLGVTPNFNSVGESDEEYTRLRFARGDEFFRFRGCHAA